MRDEVEPQWLSAPSAARYLDISENTLADWRMKGKGPAFARVGQRMVRYAKADLDAFMREQV